VSGEEWSWFWGGLALVPRRTLDPDTVDRLARARALIDLRYADDMQLDALAREACYSRFHFVRLFRQAYGDTPHRALAERRMAEARRLLATTELPVTEVCLAVGLHSLGSFSRTFRARVGEPPIAYRRRAFPSVEMRRPIPGCFVRMFVR
jgi:AraC-like DNA-binding protein